jgi:pantoate--beta-alanine ligase
MTTVYTVKDLQKSIDQYKLENLSIGFIPTMGALHAGHISLLAKSKQECAITVVSIFVNPTQFNNKLDFEKYPRLIEEDSQLLEESNCDVLFIPSVTDMYENPDLQVHSIDIGYLDTILEGAERPGHYQGVVTIVEKLLLAVKPDKIYLGLKDFQQVKVIQNLIAFKRIPTELIRCETLRESNGLAMSSRNMRLTALGKEVGSNLYKALLHVANNKNEKDPKTILAESAKELEKYPIVLEYLELRNGSDLTEVRMNEWSENINYVILIAAWVEGVRLIDNLEF